MRNLFTWRTSSQLPLDLPIVTPRDEAFLDAYYASEHDASPDAVTHDVTCWNTDRCPVCDECRHICPTPGEIASLVTPPVTCDHAFGITVDGRDVCEACGVAIPVTERVPFAWLDDGSFWDMLDLL